MASARTAGHSHVYLDSGTYPEAVSFTDSTPGIVLEGSWTVSSGAWTRDCAADARSFTVIGAPTAIAVSVLDVTHASGLAHLTVNSKTVGANGTTDQPGETVFGVFIDGDSSVFSLIDVNVVAATGGNAGPVSTVSQAIGTTACGGASDCSDGNVGIAVGAGISPSSSVGTFTAGGYVTADGVKGVAGNAGHNGIIGGTGSSKTGCVEGCSAGDPLPCTTSTGTVKANDGTCGCGGNGGGAGTPGRGGGASIAVVVRGTGATLTVTDSQLKSGTGGNGSAGGAGGAGAGGGNGSAGANASCASGCAVHTIPCTVCSCDGTCGGTLCTGSTTGNTSVTGGAAGGVGGAGGTGATGGGGAGGPSIALVTTGGAIANVGASSTLVFGTGGLGGAPAPAGATMMQLNQ
jgi:hypothetical protein